MRRKARPEAANDGTPERGKDAEKSAETRPGRPPRSKPAVAATDRNRRRGRSCALCALPASERERIDRGLIMGELSDADVAREVGVHRSNVGRHRKRHLLEPIAAEVVATVEEFNLPGEMRKLYGKVVAQLEAAEQSANIFAVRAFLAEARASVEVLLKLELAAAAATPKGPFLIEVDVSSPGEFAADVTDAPRQRLLGALPAEQDPETADEETF